MTAEDIQEEIIHEAKFNALCKANGVKIEDKSRFSSSNDIRQKARERIEKRKKEKLNV